MMILLLRWAVYLLTLLGLCAFAVNYTAWFSSFLFYAAALLPLFSLALSLWPYFALRLSFAAPMQIHRGDAADLTVAVKAANCPYFLPVTLTVVQRNLSQAANGDFIPQKGTRCQFAPYPILVPPKNGKGLPRLRAGGGIRISLPTAHTAVIRTEIRSAYICDFLGLFRLPLRLSVYGEKQKGLSHDTVILPLSDAPKGKIRTWDNSHTTAVPTTRPSEQYEIRDYRPGDALRSVHWKLTAKVDGILVREAVEPQIKVLAVAVERVRDPALSDILYDALDWMIAELCARKNVRSVIVAWIAADGRTCTQTLYDLTDPKDVYRRMLSDAIPDEMPPHAFAAVYKNVDRGYYLDTDTCIGSPSQDSVTDAGAAPAELD